jgi:hypothetical protein
MVVFTKENAGRKIHQSLRSINDHILKERKLRKEAYSAGKKDTKRRPS